MSLSCNSKSVHFIKKKNGLNPKPSLPGVLPIQLLI